MRLILTILLIGLFKAEGQMVINANAPYRPMVSANLLIDTYTGAAAAYSLRKLKNTYTGNAIRIRKDTTGQPEQDINFVGNELDTASIKSFLNARSGFIVKWYSQGDSTSTDFEQSVQASQPRIALNGVIDRLNGKPCIVFDGSNDFFEALNSAGKFNYLHNGNTSLMAYVLSLGNSSNPAALFQILSNHATGSGRGYRFAYDDRTGVNNRYVVSMGNLSAGICLNQGDDIITPNAQILITQINDADNSTAANRNIGYVNGANEIKNNTLTGSPTTGNANTNMNMGRRTDNVAYSIMRAQEFIFWSIDRSADRTTIQTNINTYYGIY